MNLLDNSIIDAYKKMHHINFLRELAENLDIYVGSDDALLDQIIEDHIKSSDIHYEVLTEELTQSERNAANRMTGRNYSYYRDTFIGQHPEAHKAFSAQRYAEGEGRIRIPLGSLQEDGVDIHPQVKGHLEMHGYHVDSDSYQKGVAHKKITVGNPEKGIPFQEKTIQKRIGSVLDETNAPAHVKRAFDNDPYRAGVNTKQFDMILSHHPEDIYGMSTGRGWTSCAQMRKHENGYNGPAARAMPHEIDNHTHIAYLVPKGGNVDTDALARISFKKHQAVSGHHETLISDGTVYGTAPHAFRAAAEREVSKLFTTKSDTVYKKHSKVYSDNGIAFHFPGTPSPENVDKAWSTTKPADQFDRGELLRHIVPGQKYKATKMNQTSKILAKTQEHIDKGDFHSATEHLNSLHDHLYRDEVFKMSYGGRNENDDTPLVSAKKKVADLFNPDNEAHMNTMREFFKTPYHSDYTQIKRDILNSAYNNHAHKPVKTAEDLIRHVKLTTAKSDASPYESKVHFSDSHQFGSNVTMKAAKILGQHGMLTKRTLQQVYYGDSGKIGKGNIYDRTVKLAADDVPGAHDVLDQTVEEIGKMDSEKQAKLLYRSRPETRRVLASKMGIDHNALIRKHKKKIDEEEQYLQNLIKKAKEGETNVG